MGDIRLIGLDTNIFMIVLFEERGKGILMAEKKEINSWKNFPILSGKIEQDFTLKKYLQLCEAIVSSFYILTVQEFLIQDQPHKSIILRHYVDKEEKWIERKLLVIDNLNARICNVCGESIVDYETLQKIEQLIENFKLIKLKGNEFTAYEIDAQNEISS